MTLNQQSNSKISSVDDSHSLLRLLEKFFICSTSMSLEEVGTVLYHGVFASFFGGWVPIRSRSLNLIVFHLYIFLSLLILPLLMLLVNGNHPVGWVLYALFTFAWFIFLKVLNYRLHQALGNDPVEETVASSTNEQVTSTINPEQKEGSDQNDVKEEEKCSPRSSNKDLEDQKVREEESTVSCQQSASSLNEVTSSDTHNNTPDIELSTLSQEAVEPSVEDVCTSIGKVDLKNESLKSPVHKTSGSIFLEREDDEDEEQEEDIGHRLSTGNRERLCKRMGRNESLSGRHDVQISNEGRSLVERAKSRLARDNHFILGDVVDRMSPAVQQAIVERTISQQAYSGLEERIQELRRGHLASSDDDASPGAIHWFEQSHGVWDFYMFDPPELDDEQEILAALNRGQLDDLGLHFEESPPTPPPPPFVPPTSNVTMLNNPNPSTEEDPLPSILILPRSNWTKVELKFSRTQLEEYMDRNVTVGEVLLSVILAVLVCVIGSLLLTLSDFFKDFWAFWLCFVMATSQFSLIKSVQSDAASPGPGQNRINALSRSIYFVFVGSLGLMLDGAVNTEVFSPLCVYGFDINNKSVLMFVRDGLFVFLLFFPLLFTLGWMPQFDTFLINLLEQIDIHVFGGTASTGLVCGLYSISRSVLSSLLLVPLGYVAFYFSEKEPATDFMIYCPFTYDTFRERYPAVHSLCTPGGRIGLSFFLGGVVSMAYILSRSTSNHQYLYDIVVYMWNKVKRSVSPFTEDPLDKMYRSVTLNRLKVDVFVAISTFVLVTVLNITSIFCQTEILGYIVIGLAALIGIFNHYLLAHWRKENPCLCFTEPCLKSDEYDMFEVTVAPKLSLIERVLQVTLFLEKNILYPIAFLLGLNYTAVYYKIKFGTLGAAILVSIVGVKVFRTAFSEISRQHMILILSVLFFNFDYRHLSEGLPLDYFIAAILFNKIYDLYLKTYFMLVYILPGSWSHPFHIVIQPLLIPHCPLIFFQAIIGAVVSAPMNPIIASSMFFLSYARPVKFWEKNYNTKRQDTSNTRLDQTLEGNLRNPNPDRLDSLFYEQLTWSLQRDMCGDITLGRWGRVTAGDIFILTNDQLNALVHVIEVGNGFVTFQLRGLEFRGTYCHQREREAITEPLASDDDSCHLPFVLPCKKLCVARWMAWEVVSSSYTLHGYSISENQAHLVFNAYIYKKAFITYYVRCLIYYLVKSPRLLTLLSNPDLKNALMFLENDDSVDVDPLFNEMYNVDWRTAVQGIERQSFVLSYFDLIQVCCRKNNALNDIDTSPGSFLVTLCFAFSLLGRRMFFTHSNTGSDSRGDNFMHGLYRMFLGDARPSSEKDDWIILDVDSIQEVIIPAARIALKVHQDNFTMSEQYESPEGMYEAMYDAEVNHVITHENDRSWRNAVVLNRPSLLALRYQRTEDSYVNPYKIIRLNSKFVKFRLVKVNRECVRGLWSSQQHELIFLRNNDSERGSIQNHKASLRNMINSSMDLPIGYPIYVSPLQTSFLDQHTSFNMSTIGKVLNPLEYTKLIDEAQKLCKGCADKFEDSRERPCSKPGENEVHSSDQDDTAQDGTSGKQDYIDPFCDSDSDDDFWEPIWIGKSVILTDASELFETFNEGWLQWPDKAWLRKAVKNSWKHWRPTEGVTTGEVVHEWRPFHIQAISRSHIDKVILLVRVNNSDNFILVKEQGVQLTS